MTAQRQKWIPLPGYIDFSLDPYEFDVDEYIDKCVPDKEMLKHPETRRALTKANPLLFALLYLNHHFQPEAFPDGPYLSTFHLAAYKWAAGTWHQKSGLTNARDAFLCPRGAGKSTTLFCLILMWAACHGFVRFVAGYSDSESTVKDHFDTFKTELLDNKLIRSDFPGMALGSNVWVEEVDGEDPKGNKTVNNAMNLKTYGGFIFKVRSISSNSLGVKVGSVRPDVILLDDIERAAGDYSPKQAQKRLDSLLGGILPQVYPAGGRVILVGTNLMQGSIIDGMIRKIRGQDHPGWIDEENFKVWWFRPFIRRPDGTKESFWPGSLPTPELLEMEKGKKFGVNFDNQPMSGDGSFWKDEDFVVGSLPTDKISYGILSIDPATTSTRKSDYTAISIVYYSKSLDRYEVAYNSQIKVTPGELRTRVEHLLNAYPMVTTIYIETTQGGDTWLEIFKGIPVRIIAIKPSKSKELRAHMTLNVYQTIKEDGLPRVVHRTHFMDLEAQMKAFPSVANDDLVDSVDQVINANEERLRNERGSERRKPLLAGRANRRR